MRNFLTKFTLFAILLARAGALKAEPLAVKVESAIKRTAVLSNYEIDIENSRGHITLNGHVRSARDRELVEEVVAAVPGVVSIQNRLTIIAPSLTSSEISKRVLEALKSEDRLGSYSVQISDREGQIAISGTVRDPSDSKRIEEIARATAGVRSVQNLLRIAPQRSDEELAKFVRSELEDRNGIDLSGISIVANEGIVTFSGARTNHRQVDQILSAALMVHGVRDIRNEISTNGE